MRISSVRKNYSIHDVRTPQEIYLDKQNDDNNAHFIYNPEYERFYIPGDFGGLSFLVTIGGGGGRRCGGGTSLGLHSTQL